MPAFSQPFCASVPEIVWDPSPHRYLTLRRVEIAKVLLAETNSSLVEIAAQTGFTDQAALTRTFANVVGATPGKWRREHSHTAGCLSKYANSHPLPQTNRSSSALEAGIHKSGPCLQ